MTNPQTPSIPPIAAQLNYASPNLRPGRPWGKGFLALWATLVFWGLGHLIAGRRRRGIIWSTIYIIVVGWGVIALSIPRMTPSLIVVVPLNGLLTLGAMFDAFRCGRSSHRQMLPRAWQRYVAGVGCLVLALFIPGWVARPVRAYLAEAYVVPSNSMTPTMIPGDRFLATKRPFEPRRWDLVVFHPPVIPKTLFVMRVVGLPGERVEIVNGKLEINGAAVNLPTGIRAYVGRLAYHSAPGPGCEGNPIMLGPDEFYILGDNSPRADDSRYWDIASPGHQLGALPREAIVGHVTTLYWPPEHWRSFR